MAEFDDHISQAKKNLIFLEKVNEHIPESVDWQVTVCFYTALHLINAHLSKFGLQYRNHNDVKHALNPQNEMSLSKLPEDQYVAYISLQMLSRRSRYLVNEKDKKLKSKSAFFTYDKHLAKAIRHLDKLFFHFNEKYSLNIDPISIKCSELTGSKDISIIR